MKDEGGAMKASFNPNGSGPATSNLDRSLMPNRRKWIVALRLRFRLLLESQELTENYPLGGAAGRWTTSRLSTVLIPPTDPTN